MTLKVTYAVCKLLTSIPRKMSCVLSTLCLYMNRKAHVACNFNYLFENEGHLKVTGSNVHYKCGNISETVPNGVVVTTDH